MKIEIAANSYESALIASKAGADRIELCANLEIGGTTPSPGQIICVKKALQIPVHALIRPRGGDFVYSELELMEIIESIHYCRSMGIEGVVLGFLTPQGEVDTEITKRVLEHTGDMDITFHRAFDMVIHQGKAMETIIDLGFDRILTSGGTQSTPEGIRKIASLVEQAEGRIVIMPGGGINENNIMDFIEYTTASEFHLSGKVEIKSPVEYQNKSLELVRAEDIHPYNYFKSNYTKIKKVVDQVKKIS